MNERDLFIAAVQLDNDAQRAAFLKEICAEDLALRHRVEALILAFGKAGSFLQQPATGHVGNIILPVMEKSGTQIGPYKLLEQIGSGGMGVVYRAEQKVPVRRMVALKVIKPGMDTQQVVARFEAERQALALMNHPNIARVLDAGATDAGRPYFVMELVKGDPITEFCDRQKLNTRERLRLFIMVCQAIQHAHQKGLIHRDIKPSNVLIEVHDVTAVPKVIDFGVAKAIGQSLTEATFHTGFGELVGTPAYMSPEQAGESSIDVDTRSDIYSLGVLLYELLTGHTPFKRDTLRNAGLDEMRRMIREVDPPRPSTRVSTLEAKVLSTVSDCRQADAHKLCQQLRGELDWIVMKALDKDRNRRYASANAMAADVQRYLDNEPVLAYPPTAGYRLRKIISQHRRIMVVVLCIVTSLLLGTGVSLWQAGEAWQAQRRANEYLKAAQTEKIRFQGLAWKSGIREAFTAWEQRQFAEVNESLERLKQSDPQAEMRPEWQMLRQELNRSFRRLLTVSAPLHEVRIIPDSTQAVAVGGDGNIYIVDLQSSNLIRTIPTGVASLHALAVSTDGHLLATGGATDPVSDLATPLIYDLQTGERLFELPGQLTTIESLEFSGDGKWLACGARYENVQVIEIETERVTKLPTARRHLWLSRSSDGQQLAAQVSVNSIWVADFFPPFSGRSIETVQTSLKSMWVPVKNMFVGILRSGTSLQVFNIDDHKPVCELIGVDDAECIQLSSDSKLLVAGLVAGDIATWSVASVLLPAASHSNHDSGSHRGFPDSSSEKTPQIELSDRWHASNSPITSVAISDDWIVATAYGGELRAMPRVAVDVNDANQGESPSPANETALAWSSDGRFVAAGRSDGSIWRANLLLTNQLSQQSTKSQAAEPIGQRTSPALEGLGPWSTLSPPNVGPVTAVAISPDQKSVAWVRQQNGIVLLRHNTEIILRQPETTNFESKVPLIDVLEFSPDSGRIAWTGEKQLYVADLVDKDSTLKSFLLPGLADCAAWSPDGNTIVAGGKFGTLVELNLKTGVLHTITDYGNSAGAIRFSDDGQRIISGHDDGSVRIWRRLDGSMKSLHLHRSLVLSIALSHDGRIGVSADADGNLAVWLVETGERIGMLRNEPWLTSTSGVLRPAIFFTPHDTQFWMLFETPKRGLALRTWDLKPTPPK